MAPGSGHPANSHDGDAGRALHARLLQGDPVAPSDLLTAYLGPLVARLCRAFPRVDETLLHDVAIDLLVKFGMQPRTYDPDRSSLSSFLGMAARGDVLNALRQVQREARRIAPLDDVELQPPARNTVWVRSTDPADAVTVMDGDAQVAALLEHFAGEERQVVELMVDGERSTGRYAAVLGIQDRPREEQAREVKRVKDRLKARLKRLWKKRRHRD